MRFTIKALALLFVVTELVFAVRLVFQDSMTRFYFHSSLTRSGMSADVPSSPMNLRNN